MSRIHKNEQKVTSATHYVKTKRLREKIILYLEQDLGSDKAYLPDGLPNHKYWLIKKIRDNVYDLAQDMIKCVTAANTIYVYRMYEYDDRRKLFTQAISDAESIMQEILLIIDYLKIKPSKYELLNEEISDCIMSIKNRRQDDNLLRLQILERDAKEKFRADSICC